MHLEVLIGAVAKELRAARPEVGEPGDVLLGRRGGCLVEVDRGHACSLLGRCHPGFPFWPLDLAEFITPRPEEDSRPPHARAACGAPGSASFISSKLTFRRFAAAV